MSRDARLMLGITLITVPTIVFGGLAVLGVVSGGAFGVPAPPDLSPLQQALYRAGHAHAGVLVLLSLVLQLALDHARLAARTVWGLRVLAPASAILVSGGFFGLAHLPALRFMLYAGAAGVAIATL